MQLKRYEAKSINEAMEKIKKDLGSNAIVLSTKRLEGEKKKFIEVIAARDSDLAMMHDRDVEGRPESSSRMYSVITSGLDELKSLMIDFKGKTSVSAELTEIKENLNTLFDVWGIRKNGTVSTYLSKAYYHLVSAGVSKRRACELLETLQNRCSPKDLTGYEHTLSAIADVMEKSMAAYYGKLKRKRISTFVGPTGAGKTTTLAKLAAYHLVGKKLKVGIITMDAYRIGAQEQLKTYADIMDVPIEIVTEKEQFAKIINKYSDRDIILVDTPGRSRKDAGHLLKLKEVFTACPSLETNLILSVTSSRNTIMENAARFGITDYSRIIFTKLDDSDCFGPIYDVIDEVGTPVSFITNGQNVPQDIQEVDPGKLARLIMKKRLQSNACVMSN